MSPGVTADHYKNFPYTVEYMNASMYILRASRQSWTQGLNGNCQLGFQRRYATLAHVRTGLLLPSAWTRHALGLKVTLGLYLQ